MGKIILYSHGGSGNHGCEAIVRGTVKALNGKVDALFSYRPEEDYKYKLDELVEINGHTCSYSKFSFKRIYASLRIHLFHDEEYAEKITYAPLIDNVKKGDIALSIGGDNYCYGSFGEYALCNKYLTKKGVKTILWGCSVEPQNITDKMAKDLSSYDLIVARESITYEALKKINKNTYLYPDPAFLLETRKVNLPNKFELNNTIGINISPMIISNEKNHGITKRNYIKLIEYLLKNTKYKIALIPHVVWKKNDDRKSIKELFEYFKNDDRIIIFEDNSSEELKYIISKCKLFIGARTHSTIAAYSTCVPTLVVGYSVKARGIAKDLFGTYENYVLPVQNLKSDEDLIKSFKFIENNQENIKNILTKKIEEYKEKYKNLPELLIRWMDEND